MNILFFTYDFPYPTNSGGKTRAYNLLKFAKKDTEITLFSFTRQRPNKSDEEAIRQLGISDIRLFPRRKVFDPRNALSILSGKSIFSALYFDKDIFSELISTVKKKNIDLVHFESFYTGFYMHHELHLLGVKQVFGTENIEFILYKNYAGNQKISALRFFLKQQVKKIKRDEEKFYSLSDCILTVTKSEEEYVRSVCAKRIEVIENGVDVESFNHRKINNDTAKSLLFIGNFTYFPNVDGVRWFMENVFLHLPKDVRFTVIGKKASRQSFLQNARVETIEYVEDIAKAYSKGTIMIAPIRIGGGTNFKILEAMASRVPVVALADRVESFGFKDGKELLIAKTAEEFAEKIARLFSDEKLRERLSENAFAAVEKRYSWTTIGTKLYNTWKSLIYEKH